MTVYKKITTFAQPLKRSAPNRVEAYGLSLDLKYFKHFTK